jgi:hypothetical protein
MAKISLIAPFAVAAAASLFIVKGTAIGPVVLTVNASRGWGVHVGDALAVLPPLAAAAFVLRRRS